MLKQLGDEQKHMDAMLQSTVPSTKPKSGGDYSGAAVGKGDRRGPKHQHGVMGDRPNSNTEQRSERRSSETKPCPFCGDTHIPGRANCPADKEKCERCERTGHRAKFCRVPTDAISRMPPAPTPWRDRRQQQQQQRRQGEANGAASGNYPEGCPSEEDF